MASCSLAPYLCTAGRKAQSQAPLYWFLVACRRIGHLWVLFFDAGGLIFFLALGRDSFTLLLCSCISVFKHKCRSWEQWSFLKWVCCWSDVQTVARISFFLTLCLKNKSLFRGKKKWGWKLLNIFYHLSFSYFFFLLFSIFCIPKGCVSARCGVWDPSDKECFLDIFQLYQTSPCLVRSVKLGML